MNSEKKTEFETKNNSFFGAKYFLADAELSPNEFNETRKIKSKYLRHKLGKS